MPIWSLTKERIEKLLKQVGDKELEIDALIKLSKEDLWNRDLDEFIEEWRFQIDDEKKRQKKVANMGRRASTKLKIGGGPAGGRKRKADSDDTDFDSAPKVKKPAAPKQPKQPGGMLGSYFKIDPSEPPKPKKTSPKAKSKELTGLTKALQESITGLPKQGKKSGDVWMDLGAASDVPKIAKAKAPAPTKKAPAPRKKMVESDDDVDEDEDEDEEVIRPTVSRNPRAAAAKPVKYNTLDSDSDGDDMLSGIGNMVKGINTTSGAVDNSRALFSNTMSRPGSSSGLPKKPTTSRITEMIDIDDTNYSMLAPPTAAKGPAPTARKTVVSDDEDDDPFDSLDEVAPPPKASKPKPASKAAAKPAAKPTAPAAKKPIKFASQPAEPKKMPLSPAAKAYAAKKAKQAKLAMEAADSEDELEQVANEIMGDDDDDDEDEDEEPAAARRPARRAAAAPKKKWVISDDEDGDEDEETTGVFEDEDSY